MRIIYVADDGTQFDNEGECELYEFLDGLSDHGLEFYNSEGELLEFDLTDSYIYNFADKVVVPSGAALDSLHKIADWCGWCEFESIDAVGTWIWTEVESSDGWGYVEKFVKEVQ